MRALPSLSLCLLLLAAAAGCGDQKAEQRRALLRPQDMRAKRNAEREKRRLFDPAGELLPSGEVTAGIDMPKGLTLHRSFESEWYFEARHIPLAALDRYFAAHLDSLGIERHQGYVVFQDALPRDEEKPRRVTVRAVQLAGGDACDVYIRQAGPQRSYPTAAQAEAQLEARRKHAD